MFLIICVLFNKGFYFHLRQLCSCYYSLPSTHSHKFSRLNRSYRAVGKDCQFSQCCRQQHRHFCPFKQPWLRCFVSKRRESWETKSQYLALAASDCWGNVSVLVGTTARACGFPSDTTLCKKHIDESNNISKVSCCFPFRGPENACKGALVLCPQRLFSVFDETKTVHHTGTMTCEGHLELADKDVTISQMDECILPTKVGVRIKYYFTFKTHSVWFGIFLPVNNSIPYSLLVPQNGHKERGTF